MKPRIAFFGNHQTSVLIAEKLYQNHYLIVCTVTKPAQPVGRKQVLTSTPVAAWSKPKNIPIIYAAASKSKPWLFADPSKITQQVLKAQPQLLIVANFTQKIPAVLVKKVKFGGLNIHPSLLPAYRGPAPVAWMLLNGEKTTGISIVTLFENFDQGQIVAQKKEAILTTDTTPILLNRLFQKSADMLLKILPKYLKSSTSSRQLPATGHQRSSYFPRLTRNHGYEPWTDIKQAIEQGRNADRIERKYRALYPWPGLWTKINFAGKIHRMKLLQVSLVKNKLVVNQVQLEGKSAYSTENTAQLISCLN